MRNNPLTIALILVCVLLLLVSFGLGIKLSQKSQMFQQQYAQRLNLEEENSNLLTKITELNSKIEDLNVNLENAQTSLVAMQEEHEKLKRLKEVLERNIQDALMQQN